MSSNPNNYWQQNMVNSQNQANQTTNQTTNNRNDNRNNHSIHNSIRGGHNRMGSMSTSNVLGNSKSRPDCIIAPAAANGDNNNKKKLSNEKKEDDGDLVMAFNEIDSNNNKTKKNNKGYAEYFGINQLRSKSKSDYPPYVTFKLDLNKSNMSQKAGAFGKFLSKKCAKGPTKNKIQEYTFSTYSLSQFEANVKHQCSILKNSKEYIATLFGFDGKAFNFVIYRVLCEWAELNTVLTFFISMFATDSISALKMYFDISGTYDKIKYYCERNRAEGKQAISVARQLQLLPNDSTFWSSLAGECFCGMVHNAPNVVFTLGIEASEEIQDGIMKILCDESKEFTSFDVDLAPNFTSHIYDSNMHPVSYFCGILFKKQAKGNMTSYRRLLRSLCTEMTRDSFPKHRLFDIDRYRKEIQSKCVW